MLYSKTTHILPFLLKTVLSNNLRFDYNLHPGAFELLENFVNDTEFVTSLLEHGCWCAKLDPDNTEQELGGRLGVDNLDRICKKWANSRSCTRLEGAACAGLFHMDDYLYTVNTDYGVSNAFCPGYENDADSCLMETCQIDMMYVQQILAWRQVHDGDFTAKAANCDFSRSGGGEHSLCETLTTTGW